jgi:hypothetical protein
MKRRQALVGLGALWAFVSGSLRANGVLQEWPAGTSGFHTLEGDVRLNGHRAKPGDRISPGDKIVTGQSSRAIYVIGDSAFLQRAETETWFFGEQVRQSLRILQGRLLSVFGPGERRIETPSASIGIRGTACYIEAEALRTYFCLCYGKAEVSTSGEEPQKRELETRYHDLPIYIQNDEGVPMTPAAVMNHSDAELIQLERLVGRRPPFLDNPDYTSSY